METKHTPGPWRIADPKKLDPSLWPPGLPAIEGSRGHMIAGLAMGGAKGTANAALIIASPDLLECVSDFVEAWGNEVENDAPMNGGDVVDWVSGAMLQFRVALAKARRKP